MLINGIPDDDDLLEVLLRPHTLKELSKHLGAIIVQADSINSSAKVLKIQPHCLAHPFIQTVAHQVEGPPLDLRDGGQSSHALLIALQEVVELWLSLKLLPEHRILVVPNELKELVPRLDILGKGFKRLRLHGLHVFLHEGGDLILHEPLRHLLLLSD